MVPSKYDQALFMWYCDGVLCGLLACHVDDILFGGSEKFHNEVIQNLRSTFTIGLEEDTNLKYLGLTISQGFDSISVCTDDYGKSLKELRLDEIQLEDEGFSAEQVTLLKQFCGQVNWISTQGRPDIAFDSCYIANSVKSGNHKIFASANKIVRKIQNQSITLNFHRDFDVQSCCIVSFSNASFANLPNSGSQGSFISLLVDENGLYSPVAWQSRKIRRAVKSTIAAECLAAVEAAEMSVYLATVIKNIFRFSKNIDTYIFCDNKNLVSAVHSSTNLEDKRLVIDVSVLRDMLEQKELTDFKWVSTDIQLANALTKQGTSDKLLMKVFNEKHRFNLNSGVFEYL